VVLVQCEVCGVIFHNPRLDDEDLRNLYGNYRSEEYRKMRFESELWNTKKFNNDIASPSSYAFCRSKLAPILREHLAPRTARRVLDYGGDRADLVAGLLAGTEAYYDLLEIGAAPGVTGSRSIRTLNGLTGREVRFQKNLHEIITVLGATCGIFGRDDPSFVSQPRKPSRALRVAK
jgi:hypothetical protein